MFSNSADCGNDVSNTADCGGHLMGWHDTPWMWLSMLVFSVLLITLIYVAFRGAASSRFSLRRPDASDILEQRLARGDISPEEYRDRLDTLDSTSEPTAQGDRAHRTGG